MKLWYLLLACSVLASLPAFAQDNPRLQFFFGYSFGHIAPCGTAGGNCGHQGSESPENANLNGWNTEQTFFLYKNFGLTGDLSGYYGNIPFTSQSTLHSSTYEYLFGPVYRFPFGRFSPFAHGLFGIEQVHLAATQQTFNNQNGTGAVFGFGGGLDVPVRGFFKFRPVQFDYLWAHTPHNFLGNEFTTGNPSYSSGFRYSAGLVFQF
jgi:hypothetical protein